MEINQKPKYREIHGCPEHGIAKGFKHNGTLNESGETLPCYVCHICKKVYIDKDGKTSESIEGRTAKVGKDHYPISFTIGPFPLPKRIHVYDKESKEGLCACSGNIKKRTKIITHFLLSSGETELVKGTRVCEKCNEVFITSGSYNQKIDFFNKSGIEVVQPDNLRINCNSKTGFHSDNAINNNWEEAVYGEDNDQLPEDNLTLLKPANRVAGAYYDARISFNPYQYLPWVKVFINGSQNLLISDEVGLGKTIEAGILIMEELTENIDARIIVFCPAFLREKWYQELTEKFYLDPQIYDGKTAIDSDTRIIILPISRIKQYVEKEKDFNYSLVIIDEIHYFKNSKSARYEYLSQFLMHNGDSKRIFMSATPVNNSGNDYRSIVRLFGETPDRTNTTKKQAYIHLPERNVADVYVDLTTEEQRFYDTTDVLDPFSGTIYRHIGASCLYALSKYAYSGNILSSETKEELRNSLDLLLDGTFDGEVEEDYFETMEKLPVPEIDSKIQKLIEILHSFVSGSKIVLFSHYIETVKYLHSELSKEFNVGYIYSNCISKNIACRNIKNKFLDAKKWFNENNDNTTILICSDTCREGIDLDTANILINYDLPFNPSVLEQRIGRIDRMSQKKDMYIYNFHVNGTYDDRLHFILAVKLRFINFYADYGIGNPLNITSEGNQIFDNFMRYFGQRIEGIKDFALMSNDDFRVSSRILRQIGITIDKKDFNSLQMQEELLDKLNDNRVLIEKWFDEGELKKITEDKLLKQRETMEELLGFPKKIKRRIVLNHGVLDNIVEKANKNPKFRKRIKNLIKDYDEKLNAMEITGLPMELNAADFKQEYHFGTDTPNEFVPNSVIEILRNEGASIYENK